MAAVAVGQRFERLVVVKQAPSSNGTRWACRCDCGREKVISASALNRGATRSCGCLRREAAISQLPARQRTYRTQSPAYISWFDMRRRCLDPKNPSYRWYGARGIRICERWDDFNVFLADMGERLPGMTLERLDYNGDYDPSNCVWASRSQQARNTRRIKFSFEIAAEIRKRYAAGEGCSELGRVYGTTPSHIWSIVIGRIWNTEGRSMAA